MQLSGNLPWYLEALDVTKTFSTPFLTVDMETSNLENGSSLVKENRVVLICYKEQGKASVVIDPNEEGMLEQFRAVCGRYKVLNCHNNKFELGWMRRLGIPSDHMFNLDTMVLEYVKAGNRRWALDLDSVGRRYGLGGKDPVVDSLMRGQVCPSEMPICRLKNRVRLDVETTAALAERQLQDLTELGLLPVAFTRLIVTPVLADIETAGLTLDPDRVLGAHKEATAKLVELEEQLNKMVKGKNMRSPKQMAEILYDDLGFEELKDRKGKPQRLPLTKAQIAKGITEGNRMTDTKTLEKLKAKTAAQKKFVALRKEWGKVNANLTKSLEFFKHICEERGGKFYGSLRQCVSADDGSGTSTQTHRLASSGRKVTFSDGFSGGAQFQNLPREFKKLFKASSPDHLLYEADGAGIEFRVAGDLCRDDQAKADIEGGADIHRYTASQIFGVPEAEVTKEQRTAAKADTFGPLFGKVSGTPGQIAYFEAFKKKYAGITKEQQRWISEVLRTKQLVTPWGMRFYWPGCKMNSSGWVDFQTQIKNYAIQSFATADIVLIALVYIYWRTRAAGLRCRLINTIHDSVIADIHKDDVEEYTPIVVTSFLDCVYYYLEKVYNYDFSHIPLGVGMSVAEHWSEGDETKVSYGKSQAKFVLASS